MTNYMYGYEALAEWGAIGSTESTFFVTSPTILATAMNGFSWLRSVNLEANPHLVQEWNISAQKGRTHDKVHKEYMEHTGSLSFWMPNDFDVAAADDIWLLKLPLDAFNGTLANGAYLVPMAAYGSTELMGFTLETGFKDAATTRLHSITGCVVDRMSCRARSGEPIEFTFDFIGKVGAYSSTQYISGAASRSTAPPCDWSDCSIAYANDGTYGTTATCIVEFNFEINNNLEPKYDLATSANQEFNRLIVGKQEISGSMTIDMNANAGVEMYDALLGDTSTPYSNIATTIAKEIVLRVDSGQVASTSTTGFEYRFRDVYLTDIPLDIDPTKIQELTVNWVAGYCTLAIKTLDTAGPAHWSIQSSG